MKPNKKKYSLMASVAIVFLLIAEAAISTAQQTVEKGYIIGAGDELNIQVWDHDDLDRTVEVAQDGSFTFPFIGKIQASGKSVFALEQYLTEKLSEGYLVAPQLTIAVSEYKNKKVFLFGEVARPGSYVLRQNMRLLELISDAGGFTDNQGIVCTIVRPAGSAKVSKPVAIDEASDHKIITVNLTRLTAGDPKENIIVFPNDTIYISTAPHIFVTGEVRKPGELKYTDGMTVRQAISLAGGSTQKAAVGRTRIIRMNNGEEIEIKPNLGDIVSPNDIIKVPESYF